MERGDIWLIIGIVAALVAVVILSLNIEHFFPLPSAKDAAHQLIDGINQTIK